MTSAATDPPSLPKSPEEIPSERKQPSWALLITVLGVVYGDIGTSPLYAVRECFRGEVLAISPLNVLGVLSLVLWALLVIISWKYLSLVMRADLHGEGGVLALTILATRTKLRPALRRRLLLLGLFGAGLLYGDGLITPAISVLSAYEGLQVVSSKLEMFVIPLTLVSLTLLFIFQKHGTERVGGLFGPVMLVWFSTIALLGILEIARQPGILAGVSPHYAVLFLLEHPWQGFLTLGIIFLVVTGGEALYADMGHFGAAPIRRTWFLFVLPSLLINYFGQGALLLRDSTAVVNPFYHLCPSWGRIPMVVLATCATIIASQAVITGAFSLASQAVHLGYLPRITILHTSNRERGQVYAPLVNWALFVGVVALVLSFRSSDQLAAAYGSAITTTMVITTILLSIVMHREWKWSLAKVVVTISLFLTIDVIFFAANLTKFFEGGWLPLAVGVMLCTLMITYARGQQAITRALRTERVDIPELQAEILDNPPHYIHKPAVYLTANPEIVPAALLHNLRQNQVMHVPSLIVYVEILEEPWVPFARRIQIESLGNRLSLFKLHYGYMQTINVPLSLAHCELAGGPLELDQARYYLGSVTPKTRQRNPLRRIAVRLFGWMKRNANDAATFLGIPADKVIEYGMHVEV